MTESGVINITTSTMPSSILPSMPASLRSLRPSGALLNDTCVKIETEKDKRKEKQRPSTSLMIIQNNPTRLIRYSPKKAMFAEDETGDLINSFLVFFMYATQQRFYCPKLKQTLNCLSRPSVVHSGDDKLIESISACDDGIIGTGTDFRSCGS